MLPEDLAVWKLLEEADGHRSSCFLPLAPTLDFTDASRLGVTLTVLYLSGCFCNNILEIHTGGYYTRNLHSN